MRFDKQTLAWVNKDEYWIDKLQAYSARLYGMIAVSEGHPPYNDAVRVDSYYDPLTGMDYTYYNDGWGSLKWHHSPNLADNDCRCHRCLGLSGMWDEYDIIKRKIEEMQK